MARLHVLTAVTRPENLGRVAASLATAARHTSLEIAWHWRYDLAHEHVGGQQCKNDLLAGVRDGWVWCLDDDTEAHPHVLGRVEQHMRRGVQVIIVGQLRAEGYALPAAAHQVRPGGIDIGQAFMRRAAIGSLRIPADYNGDGMFLEVLVKQRLRNEGVCYLDEQLSYHNWQRLGVAA